MKKFIVIILFLVSVISKAQTKKECEDWIQYNMDKYFSYDRIPKGNDLDKRWAAYSYWFEGNYLCVKETPQGSDTAYRNYKVNKLDLSMVIKCEVDSSRNPNTNEVNRIIVSLVFEESTISGGKIERHPIINFDRNDKETTDPNLYQRHYSFMTYNYDTVESKIAYRLKKALETLATICGAKVIKDVF